MLIFVFVGRISGRVVEIPAPNFAEATRLLITTELYIEGADFLGSC